MAIRKWKRSARSESTEWEAVDSFLNAVRKRRSFSFRHVRNYSWGSSENTARVSEHPRGNVMNNQNPGSLGGKLCCKIENGTNSGDNEKLPSKNAVLTTRIRLKLKLGKEASWNSMEVIVPQPPETLSRSHGTSSALFTPKSAPEQNRIFAARIDDNSREDGLALRPCQSVSAKVDSSWTNISSSVRDPHLSGNNRQNNCNMERFSSEKGRKFSQNSSHSETESLNGANDNKYIDPGTSPDSEVINMAPDVHTGHRVEGDLLRTTVASHSNSVSLGDATSPVSSNNLDMKNMKMEQFSEETEHSVVRFPVSESKNMATSFKKHRNKEKSHFIREIESNMNIQSEIIKECSRESSCYATLGFGDSQSKNNKIISFKKRKCRLLSSAPSKGRRKNSGGQHESEEKFSKRNKKEVHGTSYKMVCISSDLLKSGNCMTEDLIASDTGVEANTGVQGNEKSIVDCKQIIDSFEEQNIPPGPKQSAWVRCDDCHKWRCIQSTLADIIEETNCPWTCKDNLDKDFADCSVSQEKSNAEINEELQISDASGEEDVHTTTRLNFMELGYRQPKVSQQSAWTLIKSNLFLHRNRKKQTIDEIMVCHCNPSSDVHMGCGEECLNRMLNIECVQGTCPCGHLCSNQQFQKRNYSKLKFIKCGKKGYGLQLEQDISRGQFLIEYVGEVLDLPTYEARQREYASKGHKHFYFMTLNGSEVIDACGKGNLGRFINHSCDPNCRTEKWMVNGEVCVGLFALRNIKRGEELTFDYNYVRVFGAAAKKCVCGSSNCRGYIGGDVLDAGVVVQEDSDDDDNLEPMMVCDDGSLDMVMATASYGDAVPMCLASEDNDSKLLACTAENGVREIEDSMPQQEELSKPVVSEKSIVSMENIEVCPLKMVEGTTGGDVPKGSLIRKAKSSTPGDAAKVKKITVSNKSEAVPQKGRKFSEVEEKLNELLDDLGGICRKKDSSKSYLKLLNFTAAPNNRGNGEPCQSSRDISIILDALLKTKSRMVLTDVINKNGLQMLHNILKQCRSMFTNIPVLRKLLKVLDYLAKWEILTSDHIITGGPPVPGKESFIDSILGLTEHADRQIHRIARSFRDNWIPWNLRKSSAPSLSQVHRTEDDETVSCSRTNKISPEAVVVNEKEQAAAAVDVKIPKKQRMTRWDQPRKHPKLLMLQPHQDAVTAQGSPPGFNSLPPPDAVAHGHLQSRFNSRLPVSYGLPLHLMHQVATISAACPVAPGFPFYPFPPLPPRMNE